MSHTARRYTEKLPRRIDVPKVPQITREQAQRLPLLDRVLLEEHQRHAARLADIRRVADKLAALDPIVQAAQAEGAYIDIQYVRQSYASHRYSAEGRSVHAVQLAPSDTFSDWRTPKTQNAVAAALLAAGWRVVHVDADGSQIVRDRIVFMHGHRAVETTCMRQWVLDAIEAGHITAATAGRHPATDTGTPLSRGTATTAPAARASQPHEG